MRLFKRLTVERKFPVTLTVALILVASLGVRFPSFFRPHAGNDELQYLALAMNSELLGFKGYNLRGVRRVESQDGYFAAVFPASVKEGYPLLERLPPYYDLPLYHKPPLFALILRCTHLLFASHQPYMVLSKKITAKGNLAIRTLVMKAQFYCVAIPIIFSLLFIAVTFMLGAAFFSHRTGIYAAFLVSISPVEILSAQNIWPDTMLSFFVLGAFTLYYFGTHRSSTPLILLSGVAAGCASLIKPSGLCVILVIVLFELWRRRIKERAFWVFFITTILVAFPWYLLFAKTYGSLFYIPMARDPQLAQRYQWFDFVLHRPWYMYLVNMPVHTPLLVLVYPAIFGVFRKCANSEGTLSRDKRVLLFLWITVCLSVLLSFKVGRELRYMLPIYPAIAVLSAEFLERLEHSLNRIFKNRLGSIMAKTMLVACGLWGIAIGVKSIHIGLGEILFPL
jgi:4-amino-4-deoxy-L-arabinose transferase-like glycosyltransferase